MKAVLCSIFCACLFTAPLWTEDVPPSDCQFSFELGRQDARKVSGWKWFWASFGVAAAIGTGSVLYMLYAEDAYVADTDGGMTALAITGFASFGLSIAVPLMVTPRLESPPSGSGIDADCYRRGYVRKLKSRNTTASVGGFLAGSAAAQVIGYVLAMAILALEFSDGI